MKILVTGAAGFIGFHLIQQLLSKNKNLEIIGIDNINDYYDVNLKYARLQQLGISKDRIEKSELNLREIKSDSYSNFKFIQLDIANLPLVEQLFKNEKFTHVVNLAAQAGVRYSLINPHAYIQSNVVGFVNLLECCRHHHIEHFIYASSSSVYGANAKIPFSEEDRTDNPVSLYAATKKSNELMAYTYSHLYDLPTTGLRFFTVYGPWGRPDMAPMLFANAMKEGKTIKVFNNGDMQRDFTYIDDIVEGIIRVIYTLPTKTPKADVLNIGNATPVDLMEFISIMEKNMRVSVKKEFLPMQDGDVKRTWADVSNLKRIISYNPSTNLEVGIQHFINWFNHYYAIN